MNLETASRDQLLAYIYDLEMKVDDLTPGDGFVLSIRDKTGASPKQAKILAALSNGFTWSEFGLRSWAGIPENSDKNLAVQISKLRKKIAPLGIEISNVYGAGYKMPAASIAALKAHLSNLRSAS